MHAHDDHPDERDSERARTAAAMAADHGAVADLRSPDDLHVCPYCLSELVYPVSWAPIDMAHWRVELRCPECEWCQAGLYEQLVLDRFDAILDEGTESLMSDLARLQRANMEGELERFTAALEQDLLLPEDF